MIKDIDWDFYNAYPRLYAICSTLGIDKGDIDNLTSKIWNDWRLNIKYDNNQTQLILKAIIMRLDKIGEKLDDLQYYKNVSDDVLKEIFGERQIEIVKVII